MKVDFVDKIFVMFSLISIAIRFPRFSHKLHRVFLPIENTRYTEFTYLIKFLKENKQELDNILDVSSPYMLAYYLADKNHKVTKTDINPDEGKNILKSSRLRFQTEDALNFSFSDNSFDLVYSISVVEHIYENYLKAIKEMIRVTKRRRFIYLTFPVSKQHVEEWSEDKIYASQKSKDGKYFFSYRFDETELKSLLSAIEDQVEIVQLDIFWERFNGGYEKTINLLKLRIFNKYLTFLKDVLVNLIAGLFIFPATKGSFSKPKDFGNAHLILRKK